MPPFTTPLQLPRPAWAVFALASLILQTAHAAHRHPRHNGNIAFADLILGKADIMTVGPDGSPPPRILIDEGFNAHPAYSLDGSRLAFPPWEASNKGISIFATRKMSLISCITVTMYQACLLFFILPFSLYINLYFM